ncbi:MAG: MBL fold metallo-hydrolase [Bacteroidales bacterium]|jgi:L-ascorbate metabolism protein UlaG (beta-lactamase superfamily)|nr:MBL fold metallo-hydrolase [Bacteroidales bacterium]
MRRVIFLFLLVTALVSCKESNTTEKKSVKVQLIRNATMKIEYAGKTILTDPMFSDKAAFMSFVNPAENKNPTVDLPVSINNILSGVDFILLSHVHPDHLDPKAVELIDKNIPLFYQSFDSEAVTKYGFKNATVVDNSSDFAGIEIIRTGGKHGEGDVLKHLGEVSGFVLKAENYPTIYWIGDCILDDEIKANITKYNPDIIITHSGGAKFMGQNLILMDSNETIQVSELAPKAKVVAVHMESLDHCFSTREDLKKLAEEKGITNRIIIPADGEAVVLD